MSFKCSDYLEKLAKIAQPGYVSGYMLLGEVLKTLSIHSQSFEISKQNFFHSPITEQTSSGVKYTRAPLGARGKSACSMVQTCKVNWTITIPANTLAKQLNKTYLDCNTTGKLIARTNFNGKENPLADWTDNMTQASQGYFDKTAQGVESSEHLQFWIGFSTACGPFYQFQLLNDATALWGSAIYAREQAVISGNSLSDLRTKNSDSVSQLESIIERKRHCGVFIDIPLCEIDRYAAAATVGTPFYYRIPNDITFSGVLDLNQLNLIFNSFPVLIPYHMIPPEKPDTVYLLSGYNANGLSYQRYNNQNGFKQFIGTRAYTNPTKASITPMMHYLCDAFVRNIFDDCSMPQVLNVDVIGEVAKGVIQRQ
ncbi:MAG: hypothetical protein EZS28_002786 [Streblomastix strix]|uniref:Uncharacterized protein n=1 Tax=Streblomastix strix TaxID=222440 RepID=A0A5J4X4G8_9EUKA|nr:MAG: hypothetical protein EZS28_002786 [Streblomastix strix]